MSPAPARLALIALLLGAAAPATAQEPCHTARPGMAVLVSGIRTELADGAQLNGLEAGLEARDRFGGFHFTAGAGYALFEDAPGKAIAARVRVERRLFERLGLTVCGALLGGGSVLHADPGGAWTVAGGAALTATRSFQAGDFTLSPYLGVRGLGARTSGEIVGGDFTATGWGVGGEGGIGADRGLFSAALRVTVDGLDAALGPLPYPTIAVRLVVGWRL